MAVKTFTAAQKAVRLTDHYCVGDFWANPALQTIKLDTTLAEIWERFYARFGALPRLRNQYANGKIASRYAPVASAGYRVAAAGGASKSQHLYGRGVDFEIPGVPAWELAKYAERLPEVGGIGLYHNAGDRDVCEHIHIDTRGNRARWGWRNLYSNSGRLVGFGGVPSVYKRGTQGAAVEAIQDWLKAQGYNIKPDGEYGPVTANALADWQRKHGLTADGAYGPKTDKVAGVFRW